MELHAKLVRSQLSFFKPFVAGLSLGGHPGRARTSWAS